MDYAALAQIAIGLFGEEKASKMTAQQLRLLEQQLADVRNIELPDLPKLEAAVLGDSAVAGMKSDPALRANQLAAINELRGLADSGGLDLSDRAALEQALDVSRNQTKRTRAGISSELGARGQLDSGAKLTLDLDAASRGANDLRKEGLETAAMAQRRRLQAIRDAAGMSGALREQDWRETESANRAKDIRDERNAAARERAAQYNAGLPQQGFTNQLAKAQGQLPSTSAVGNAYANNAADTRAMTAGLIQATGSGGGGAYSGVTKNAAADTGGSTYTYDHDATHSSGSGSHDPERKDDDERRDHG